MKGNSLLKENIMELCVVVKVKTASWQYEIKKKNLIRMYRLTSDAVPREGT